MKNWSLINLVLLLFCSACENMNLVEDRATPRGVVQGSTFNEGESALTPTAYVDWVQDVQNGLKREKKIEDIVFSAQYKPAEYVICMEEKSDLIADSIVKRKTEELQGMQYIDFKIALSEVQMELLKYKITTAKEYDDRVKYYSFNMQKDVVLVEGNDTIPCSLFHFERGYDAAPYSTFLLGFSYGNNDLTNKTLIVRDKIFSKGIIKIEFEANSLNRVPKLKTTI